MMSNYAIASTPHDRHTLALPCEDDAVTVERVEIRGPLERPKVLRDLVAGVVRRGSSGLRLDLTRSYVGKREADMLYAAAKDAAKVGMSLTVRVTPDQHTVLTSSGSPWPCQWEVEA